MKRFMMVLVIPALFAAGCSGDKTVRDSEVQRVQVTVCTAENRQYTPVLYATGTINPCREASVGAALPGRVDRIYVHEGDRIRKGALLAELSDELLTTAEIEYKCLKKDYERVQRLSKKQAVSEQQLDHIRAKYEAAEAKYNLLLDNTRIRTPFSGTVVELLMEEGEVFTYTPALKPGYSHAGGIVRVMKLDPLLLEMEISEKDLGSVSKGMEGQIFVDAFPGDTMSGRVTGIRPMLSKLSRTATVTMNLPNRDRKIMPGMFARVRLGLPAKMGIVLPRSAVNHQRGTDVYYVFVVNNGRARRKNICRIGEAGNDLVVTGVDEGDRVVVAGKSRLTDNIPVCVGGDS